MWFKYGLWTAHFQTFILVFGLAGAFLIIVLLHKLSALELPDMNWWSDILLYGSRPSPEAAKQPQTITTMCDVLFMKYCVSQTLQVQLLSRQSTEYLHTLLGIIKMLFGKYEMRLCVLVGQLWFSPWPPLPWMHFHPVFSLLLNHELCSSLAVVLGSFVTSWMRCWCALRVILVGRTLLDRFTIDPRFLRLWIMALTMVQTVPKL